jgi:hypothetical protein
MLIFINLAIWSTNTTGRMRLSLTVFRIMVTVVFYSKMYQNNILKVSLNTNLQQYYLRYLIVEKQ